RRPSRLDTSIAARGWGESRPQRPRCRACRPSLADTIARPPADPTFRGPQTIPLRSRQPRYGVLLSRFADRPTTPSVVSSNSPFSRRAANVGRVAYRYASRVPPRLLATPGALSHSARSARVATPTSPLATLRARDCLY